MSQLKPQEIVRLGDIQMANHLPFVLFGGMNVLESKDLAFEIADREAADLAAGATPTTAAPAGQQAALLPDEDHEGLQKLVQRLDQALGDDGRLI